MAHQSAQFSATLRVHLVDRPGAFAALAAAVAEENGLLDAIDLVRADAGTKTRDVTVLATDAEHIDRIVAAVRRSTASSSSTSPTGRSCSTSAASWRSSRGRR